MNISVDDDLMVEKILALYLLLADAFFHQEKFPLSVF